MAKPIMKGSRISLNRAKAAIVIANSPPQKKICCVVVIKVSFAVGVGHVFEPSQHVVKR